MEQNEKSPQNDEIDLGDLLVGLWGWKMDSHWLHRHCVDFWGSPISSCRTIRKMHRSSFSQLDPLLKTLMRL